MNVLNAVEVIDKIIKNETSKSNTILNENLKYLVDDADYIKSEHIATGVVPMRLKFVTDIENYSLTGNTMQSGTPTPETPVEIVSVGDKTKNLTSINTAFFNKNTSTHYVLYDGNLNAGTYTISGYQVTKMGANTRNTFGVTIADPPEIKYQSTSTNRHLNPNTYSYTFTITKNTNIKIELWIAQSDVDVEYNNIMLNSGNIPLPYEPYNKYKLPIVCGKHTTNIYLNTPLMTGEVLANNIKDVLWGKLVLTGNENWTYSATSNIFYLSNLNIDYKKTQYATINYMSSHFKSSASSTGGAEMSENTIRFYNGLSNVNEIYIKYNDVGDVTAFKNWLMQQYIANTPVTVCYQLKTPLTENVTMPKILNVRGTNIFDVKTSVKPLTVTVKYK